MKPTETSINDDYIARIGRNSSNQYRGNPRRRHRGRGRVRGYWTCGGFTHDHEACREKMREKKAECDSQKRNQMFFMCKSHVAREGEKAYERMDDTQGKINAAGHYLSDSGESL